MLLNRLLLLSLSMINNENNFNMYSADYRGFAFYTLETPVFIDFKCN